MGNKFRTFIDKLKDFFSRNRRKNLEGRLKVRNISLNKTEDRGNILVKRETDGDGGCGYFP